jgi:ribulose-phosphate 3-epimerase
MEKITLLRKMKPRLDIEVDGGITPQTIETVDRAGANLFVSGSYLVKSDNMQERIRTLYSKLQDAELPI